MPTNLEHHLDESRFHELLDHALTGEEKKVVQAHLDKCAECRSRFINLQLLFAGLEAMPEEPLARDLSPSVLEAIRPQKRKAQIPVLLAIAVSTLVILILRRWSDGFSEIEGFVFQGLEAQLSNGLKEVNHFLTDLWYVLSSKLPEISNLGFKNRSIFDALVRIRVDGWGWIAAAIILWLGGNVFLLRGVKTRVGTNGRALHR
jgi:hypothetical protein